MPVGPRERKVAQFAFEEYHKQEGESDECQFETFKVNWAVSYPKEYNKQEGESDKFQFETFKVNEVVVYL